MILKIFLFNLFVFFGIYGFAQSSSTYLKQSIDSLIMHEMQIQHIPGLSIAVLRDGKIDFIQGYGFSNIEHQIKVKPETVFQSGSVGKQFTAFAIMLLAEEGKLSLDDKLSKFFPDASSSWDSITIKHLLTHTSGLGDIGEYLDFRKDYLEDSLYRIIRNLPLQFNPGEEFYYSNAGYIMLGVIIGKVTGEFYGEFLKKRIFVPLEMNTTRIITEKDIVFNRAAGYQLVNDTIQNQEWIAPSLNTTADGSLYLTAIDLAKWESGLNTGKLLSKESYQEMWTPVKLNNGILFPYGYGWEIDTLNGFRMIQHDGAWQGFVSTIMRCPEKKASVIVLANLEDGATRKIAKRVIQLFEPTLKKSTIVNPRKDNKKVSAFLEEFITNLTLNSNKESMFEEDFWLELQPYFEEVSINLNKLGPLLNIDFLEVQEQGTKNVEYRVRAYFEKDYWEFFVVITNKSKIAYYEINL